MIETEDYWAIIALQTSGHIVKGIRVKETDKGERGPTLVYSFAKEAEADYEAWMRGEPSPVFDIVREVQVNTIKFKKNLYRYSK